MKLCYLVPETVDTYFRLENAIKARPRPSQSKACPLRTTSILIAHLTPSTPCQVFQVRGLDLRRLVVLTCDQILYRCWARILRVCLLCTPLVPMISYCRRKRYQVRRRMIHALTRRTPITSWKPKMWPAHCTNDLKARPSKCDLLDSAPRIVCTYSPWLFSAAHPRTRIAVAGASSVPSPPESPAPCPNAPAQK